MFNSPVLDVAIGLVFIFLLYSLLATSINEAIATIFALRSRMLKTGIVESMLANTSNDNRWTSLLKGIKEFLLEILKYFTGKREKKEEEKKLGDKFFEHPLIKNYGSSRLFPIPSYIPSDNFSTVLIAILKQEFNKRIDEIAKYKLSVSTNSDSLAVITQNLRYSTDIIKIKEILDYYTRYYDSPEGKAPPFSVIDRDTCKILSLHLHESMFAVEKFIKKIEDWFNDSMNRISGWYKRQTQAILFFLGLTLAIIFNVDTIEISGRLSTDKDARDKLVQFAIQATDKFKDDPMVKKMPDGKGGLVPDTLKVNAAYNDSIFKRYQAQSDSIKNFIDTDIKKANDIIAIGWGDYGKHTGTACKIEYVLCRTANGKKFLGFLLTAFAISLGAPFWFDLLNKLIKLRSAGKKEGSDDSDAGKKSGDTQPLTVNVNTQTGEEAVG